MKPIHKTLLTLVVMAVLAQAWFLYSRENAVTEITLAASNSGDSYKMAQAISAVVTKIYPNTKIKIKPTKGSVESMRLIPSLEHCYVPKPLVKLDCRIRHAS
jgi:TRAP-type uncharacterized transport system substrate-binding protein